MRIHQRAAVKNIDIAAEREPLFQEHVERGHGVVMGPPERLARRLGQERHVDRVARHEIGDELVAHGGVGDVRGLELHVEERLADGVPEGLFSLRPAPAAQLGADRVGDQLAMLGDKEIARTREELAVAAAARVRREEQGADFAAAGEVMGRHQQAPLDAFFQLL